MTGNERSTTTTRTGPTAVDLTGSGPGVELVDAIVSAVDLDRSDAITRVQAALQYLELDRAFADELRLSGVPSITWQRCQFCSEVIDEHNIAEEAA